MPIGERAARSAAAAAAAAATAPPPPTSAKQMSTAEAIAAARAEGLTLVESDMAATGFRHVAVDGNGFRSPANGKHPNFQCPTAAGCALELARWNAGHRYRYPGAAPVAQRARGGSSSGGGKAAGEPAVPRVPEAILEANGVWGTGRRYRTKWVGLPKDEASWECQAKLPTEMLIHFEETERKRFNREEYHALEPEAALLGEPGTIGVATCEAANEADAAACARYLLEHWGANGVLALPNGSRCMGYASYGKTLKAHDASVQSKTTLLITNALLPAVRKHVAGFEALETAIAVWLHERYGRVVSLFYAHALRQGMQTQSATGFDVHQDTEDYPDIEYTVVVKLTADELGEAASSMRVVGAAEHFEYGARAGAAGCFLARAYHASCPPRSDIEHLKIAFFFKVSEKADRRACRLIAPPADKARAPQQRRPRPQRTEEEAAAAEDVAAAAAAERGGVLQPSRTAAALLVMHELNAANMAAACPLPR